MGGAVWFVVVVRERGGWVMGKGMMGEAKSGLGGGGKTGGAKKVSGQRGNHE